MKLQICLNIIILLLFINTISCDFFLKNKKPSPFTPDPSPPHIFKSPSFRKLEQSFSQPIRIFADTTYIKSQSSTDKNLQKIVSLLEPALKKCINTFNLLLNVTKISEKLNIISNENLNDWKFSGKINPSLMENGEGISADLIILLKFPENEEEENFDLATSYFGILDEETKRPLVGIIKIDKNINLSLNNSDLYLESILLHEITHVLGFHYELFQYFPGGLGNIIYEEEEQRTGVLKKFIKTPKLLEFAKKYFNCNSLTGVELENQEKNLKNSHWEARILLGEYMTSSPYTPEQVISEFTLYLLEDSGWYKANFYTGGLMKFGKNMGCDFLEKDCLVDGQFTEKTYFENEFCNFYDDGGFSKCSSGRQSRAYCSFDLNSDIKVSNYYRLGNFGGKENVDYCPINDNRLEEEQKNYYIGNCKNGNGLYGSYINYKDIGHPNQEFPEIFGEKYGENSFCALINLIPKIDEKNEYSKYANTIHSMCYPMYCSKKKLTIKIYDKYVVCPVTGGKVQVEDYNGFLFCPDYNLICTGTVFCNDMFDCVQKKSLAKSDTYDYDYEKKNSQIKKTIENWNIDIGYETEDDGKCPQNCVQCKENKKCIKCINDLVFISDKKDNVSPVNCIEESEIDKNKYCLDKDDNIYYKQGSKNEIEIDNIQKKEQELVKKAIDEIEINGNDKTYIKIYEDTENKKAIIIYKKDEEGENSIIDYIDNSNKNIINTNTNEIFEIIEKTTENLKKQNKKSIIEIAIDENKVVIKVYDEEGNKIDIEKKCPECTKYTYTIKINDIKSQLQKEIGPALTEIITKNGINVFNENEKIFNDMCSNFSVSGVDIPVSSRKNVFYMGDNNVDEICGGKNCTIENIENYICKCQISTDFNNNIQKINITNSKNKKANSFKDSFDVFKCFSTDYLKTNEGMYITVCTIFLQSVSLILYLFMNPKMPSLLPANPIEKKSTNKDKKSNNSLTCKSYDFSSKNSLNNKVNSVKNQSKDDSESNNCDEFKENNIKAGFKKEIKNNNLNNLLNRLPTEKVLNIDDEELENDSNSNLKKKRLDNIIINSNQVLSEFETINSPKNIEEKILDIKRSLSQLSNINDNDCKSLNDENAQLNNLNKEKKNNNANENNNFNTPSVVNNTNDRLFTTNDGADKTNENDKKNNLKQQLQPINNNRLRMGDRTANNDMENINKRILILFRDKNLNNLNKNRNRGHSTKKKRVNPFVEDKNIVPLDYLPLDKAIISDKRTFLNMFWSVFSYKQVIINCFGYFKFLKITESFIPVQFKIIRFLFLLVLNMFINSMTITQNYFHDKYEFFNKRYHIDEEDFAKLKIDPFERLNYAMNNCFPEVFITFVVCEIVQFIINFIFFGTRRHMNNLALQININEISDEVNNLVKKAKIKYIIFAFVNLLFMIVFFVYLTNFTNAYSGGALDYIGAGIWTFILLQLFPVVSCSIITLLRYYGIKKNKIGLYKISQILQE